MGKIGVDLASSGEDNDIMSISELPRDRLEAAFNVIRNSRSAAEQKPLHGSSETDYAKKFAQIRAALDEDYVEDELDRWLLPLHLRKVIGLAGSEVLQGLLADAKQISHKLFAQIDPWGQLSPQSLARQ
ncbi:MAG: hypothetical protein RLZZ126_1817 [Pseudomonadota bacterium]